MLSSNKQPKSIARLIAAIFVSCLLALSVAHAGNDKEKKAKGKPDKEQVMNKGKHKDKSMKRDSDHEADYDEDRDYEKDKKGKKDKKDKKDKRDKDPADSDHDDDYDEESKGLDKQRDMKSEQERKELDKGSEKGQASREEHSRKWWKFWGDEE
jgi:hypothetical protein